MILIEVYGMRGPALLVCARPQQDRPLVLIPVAAADGQRPAVGGERQGRDGVERTSGRSTPGPWPTCHKAMPPADPPAAASVLPSGANARASDLAPRASQLPPSGEVPEHDPVPSPRTPACDRQGRTPRRRPGEGRSQPARRRVPSVIARPPGVRPAVARRRPSGARALDSARSEGD